MAVETLARRTETRLTASLPNSQQISVLMNPFEATRKVLMASKQMALNGLVKFFPEVMEDLRKVRSSVETKSYASGERVLVTSGQILEKLEQGKVDEIAVQFRKKLENKKEEGRIPRDLRKFFK